MYGVGGRLRRRAAEQASWKVVDHGHASVGHATWRKAIHIDPLRQI